ncbi:MAG: class B sortase [Clostridiales bacterium]|jgi:sortase B|nr:class B sortase [Clostridiales bacterium]
MQTLFRWIKRLTIIAVLTALSFLIVYQLTWYNEQQKLYELRQEAQNVYEQAEPSPTTRPTAKPEPTAKPPEIDSRINALREEYQNDDIIGFLSIEGTNIEYPVLQTDNNEFYLNHGLDKAYSAAGSLFLDYENDSAKEDKNTIVYGHNMNADIMFHSLRKYTDKEFFDTHRYITFNTLYASNTWEIFSFYRATADFYYIQAIFRDEDEFGALLEGMVARSMHESDVSVTKEDRVLTLSTCTNETDGTFFVVNAKLVATEAFDE